MKKHMKYAAAFICTLAFILSSGIRAWAGEFDNAKDYYDTYGFNGAYNAEEQIDNALRFTVLMFQGGALPKSESG